MILVLQAGDSCLPVARALHFAVMPLSRRMRGKKSNIDKSDLICYFFALSDLISFIDRAESAAPIFMMLSFLKLWTSDEAELSLVMSLFCMDWNFQIP